MTYAGDIAPQQKRIQPLLAFAYAGVAVKANTKLGITPFTVTGSGQAAGLMLPPVTASAQATLQVTRTIGAFAHVYMLPNPTPGPVGSAPVDTPSCNGTFSSRYEIGQNSNQVTFFSGSPPAMGIAIGGPYPALYYLLSRRCRVGLMWDALGIDTAGLAVSADVVDLIHLAAGEGHLIQGGLQVGNDQPKTLR